MAGVVSEPGCLASGGGRMIVQLSWGLVDMTEQETQLPQRNSASAVQCACLPRLLN